MPKNPDEQPGGQPERQLPRGVKLLRAIQAQAKVESIAFDPTGRTLASGGDNAVELWDADSGLLLRTLKSRGIATYGIAFDPTGRTLASGNSDNTVRLWEVDNGKQLRVWQGYKEVALSVAFDPAGRTLAAGYSDGMVKLWQVDGERPLHTLGGVGASLIWDVAFDPTGRTLASGGGQTVKMWDAERGQLLRALEGHSRTVFSVAFDPTGRTLASGSHDRAVKLWEADSGKLLRTLEGHTHNVNSVAFSPDGRLLASKSFDGTLRLWSCETWDTVAVIPESASTFTFSRNIAFHPTAPLLASVGLKPGAAKGDRSRLINFWELDFDALLGRTAGGGTAAKAVHHTTAKIVLVGDSGVGKSGLAWRLAHGEFKETASTHGQQFWVLPQLGKLRDDGTECEAILWDLAGQPDYRLIHALFLSDVDLALVLFDPSDISDPLSGVEFWLKQLEVGREAYAAGAGGARGVCRSILVGARADRGTPALTLEELNEFCRRRGINGYVSTSSRKGWGVEELVGRMKESIPWDDKPATTTTATFKRIKDYVLRLKEGRQEGQPVVVTPDELRERLQRTDAGWRFSREEMLAAVGHLENYGYVKRLRTSKGEERILLAPELLNNLAASFVLEARRNPKGLGSLEEGRLLADEYPFGELEKLSDAERLILLDSAALLFLEHNVCFRETDPLGGRSYLVFPELINLKKPVLEDEQPTADGLAYTVAGAVENVYASLVVLLGYTQTFTRTNQWRNHARYEVGDKLICGFRQEAERDGELDFVLYFGANVGRPVQTLFQGLFESLLARRNLSVSRYEPVVCANGHPLSRDVVRAQLRKASAWAFCPDCGDRVALPRADEPIRLTRVERHEVDEQQWFAAHRSRYEQAVFQVMSYVKEQTLRVPECFISYAWGDRGHERWVERNLAADLQKAGIAVVLDRWENARFGSSVSRFVERIERCDRVIVVGTPLYRKKYENRDTSTGYVVAAEVDLISNRLLGTEARKETVLPLLLDGEKESSLPPLMHNKVYADFRNERAYFTTAFDLIISLYEIAPNHPAVADLRESLREPDTPHGAA